MSSRLMRNIAGGLAAGVGAGMVARSNLLYEQAMEEARAQRRAQERQEDRAWAVEDRTATQGFQREMEQGRQSHAAGIAASGQAHAERMAQLQHQLAQEREAAALAHQSERDAEARAHQENITRLEAELRETQAQAQHDRVVGDRDVYADTWTDNEGTQWGRRHDGTVEQMQTDQGGLAPAPRRDPDYRTGADGNEFALEGSTARPVTTPDGEPFRPAPSGSNARTTAEWNTARAMAEIAAQAEGREVTEQDILDSYQMVRQSNGASTQQLNVAARIYAELKSDIRDRRSDEEKWALAQQRAGIVAAETAENDGGGLEVVAPAAGGSDMPSPKSRAEYDALPSGARYVAPDGSLRTKP